MALHSYVGGNTILKGNFECKDDFLIEGAVEGALRSEGTIVLGREAVVRGEVCAREVAVSGIVVGSIRCLEKLSVFESAKIVGTIQSPIFKMEAGAKVNGRMIMSHLEEIELVSDPPDETTSSKVQARN